MSKLINTALEGLTGQNKIGGSVVVGDNLIMQKTTGKGIKVDELSPAFGYRDITADIVLRGIGTDPTWSQIDATVFYGYKFIIGKKAYLVFHVPHDYVPGSDIFIHVHFLTNYVGVNKDQPVKWQFTTAFAKGYNRGAFNLGSPNVTTAEATPTQLYDHCIAENGAITLTDLEVDSLIMVELERITNGGTDNTDDVFVLTADVHYMSNDLATKDKNYPFYT